MEHLQENADKSHNPQPEFLGVTLDRMLIFGPHIHNVSTKTAARCRLLASLTSKAWAWRKDQLMKVYKALQLSLLTYAALAWQPSPPQLKDSDERPASAASQRRLSA